MDILTALKKDHDEAKSLLDRIVKSKSGATRAELFAKFKSALTKHSRAEEAMVYERLKPEGETAKNFALEGYVEHEVADRLIADLSRARKKDSEEWTARVTVLKELLEHHIEEEEGDMFSEARKAFEKPEREAMADEFKAAKQKVRA